VVHDEPTGALGSHTSRASPLAVLRARQVPMAQKLSSWHSGRQRGPHAVSPVVQGMSAHTKPAPHSVSVVQAMVQTPGGSSNDGSAS
jgi:hypothetical protein